MVLLIFWLFDYILSEKSIFVIGAVQNKYSIQKGSSRNIKIGVCFKNDSAMK